MEKEKILIVDEYEINRAILSELFSREYDILEAGNGQDAVSLLSQPNICLIFLDARLPTMDTRSLLRMIRTQKKLAQIPVLLMVNSTDDEKVRLMLPDVADVIYRPFHPGIIRRRVSRILEMQRLEQNTDQIAQAQLTYQLQWLKGRELSDYMIIDVLSTVLEFRMHDAGGHVQRIRLLTCLLLEQVKERWPQYHLTDEIIRQVGLAAMMHDVGKIAVPDKILEKPGPLNVEEYEQAKQHTTAGTHLLKDIGFLTTCPAAVIIMMSAAGTMNAGTAADTRMD